MTEQVEADGGPGSRMSAWQILAWTAVLSGPIGYAASRMIAESFYGRFGVLPGEVGLSYAALLAPAILVMFVTTVVGAVLIVLGRLALGIGGVAVFWAVVTFVQTDSLHSWRGLAYVVAALLAFGLLAALGVAEESAGRRMWLVIMVVLALTVATLALRTVGRAADDVRDRRPVTLTYLGLPFTAIRARAVRLTGVQSPAAVPRDRCLMLLGSARGVSVLVDGDRVWRVPSDSAMTASGCP
ncbi:hypothetical protein [Asanoa siamensis]|uniref:Uncharacterized protein n=1 Tax=Asanoa siamensis TaxID=926357 RepID=A0ABQ4D4P9_9ACTN|nr:hypothetical protein [Asanoa siamensis]GIF78475.1 hypothetical protein Asi02nite_79930 [Asanoa siamensis]